MTEILLLGSMHFIPMGDMVYRADAQAQLRTLAEGLARFHPDGIAIECAAHEQAAVDRCYANTLLSDFDSEETMKTKTLGTVHMFGADRPCTFENESVQIGFRLGKMLGLEKIYAVDEDMELEEPVFSVEKPLFDRAMADFAAMDEAHKEDTLLEEIRFVNAAEWSRKNQALYMAANADGGAAGSRFVAAWYERNVYIHGHILRAAARCKRLLVIYGAGHLHILREMLAATPDVVLTDTQAYI